MTQSLPCQGDTLKLDLIEHIVKSSEGCEVVFSAFVNCIFETRFTGTGDMWAATGSDCGQGSLVSVKSSLIHQLSVRRRQGSSGR